MSSSLPQKIIEQINKAGLPTNGKHPFLPRLTTNKKRESVIEKRAVTKGPNKASADMWTTKGGPGSRIAPMRMCPIIGMFRSMAALNTSESAWMEMKSSDEGEVRWKPNFC